MFRFSSRFSTAHLCHTQQNATFLVRPALPIAGPQLSSRRLFTNDSSVIRTISQDGGVQSLPVNPTVPDNAADTARHEQLGHVEEPSSGGSNKRRRDPNTPPFSSPLYRSALPTTLSTRLTIREKYGQPTRVIKSSKIPPYPKPVVPGVHVDVVTSYTLAPQKIHLPGTLPTLNRTSSMNETISEQEGSHQVPSHISALQACRRLGNLYTVGLIPNMSTTPDSLSKLLLDPLNSIVIATHVNGLVEFATVRAGQTQMSANDNATAPKHERAPLWDDLSQLAKPDAKQGAYRYIKYIFGDLILMVMDHTDAWRSQDRPARSFLAGSDDPARSVDFTVDGMQVVCGGPIPEVYSTAEITTEDPRGDEHQARRRRWRHWFARTRAAYSKPTSKTSTLKPIFTNPQKYYEYHLKPMEKRLQRLHGVLFALQDAVYNSKSGMCYMLSVQGENTSAAGIDHEIYEAPTVEEGLMSWKELANAKAALWERLRNHRSDRKAQRTTK